jgi:uncharacterized protein (TIGR02118 family)
MIRSFAFMPRRPDVTPETFHEHWLNVHGPLALHITSLRRYVQSHCLSEHPSQNRAVELDGIAETWFDDAETAAALREDPQFTEYAKLDEPNFIDLQNISFVMADEVSRTGGMPARDEDGVKVLMLFRRDPTLTAEAFADMWRGADEEPAADAVGALRHARSITAPIVADPVHDGIRELWFASRAEAEAAGARDPKAWAALAGPDGSDPGSTSVVLVREHRMVWPG